QGSREETNLRRDRDGCPCVEPPSNWNGRKVESAVLKGRRGVRMSFWGAGETRGRAARKGRTIDPWRSVWCSPRADTVVQKVPQEAKSGFPSESSGCNDETDLLSRPRRCFLY